MKTYYVRVVSNSSLSIEANSKEEAMEKANKFLMDMDATQANELQDNGSGWEVDDDEDEE